MILSHVAFTRLHTSQCPSIGSHFGANYCREWGLDSGNRQTLSIIGCLTIPKKNPQCFIVRRLWDRSKLKPNDFLMAACGRDCESDSKMQYYRAFGYRIDENRCTVVSFNEKLIKNMHFPVGKQCFFVQRIKNTKDFQCFFTKNDENH